MTTMLKMRLSIGLIYCCILTVLLGCHHRQNLQVAKFHDAVEHSAELQRIEYPDVCDISVEDTSQIQTAAPITVRNYQDQEPWPMTLEEAIELALANSQVLQKLGGAVVRAPQGTATVFDPAIQETDPNRGAEAALSDFDAQYQGLWQIDHSESVLNFGLPGVPRVLLSRNDGNFNSFLSKTTATGAEFTVSNQTTYQKFSSSPDDSLWGTLFLAEYRQPLLRNAGTAVNRIAGPNAQPGVYQGVLIARIAGDIALTDFEIAVRDLVLEVERNYWELYYAYRDLDVKIRVREAARLTWDNRKKRVDAGLSRPDDEAQTRQQYFSFETQVNNALSGNASGQSGVLGAERQLRRLLGLLNSDGRLIRPTTEPTIAPVLFDWEDAQQRSTTQRAEIRRQKWNLRQRELELYAAQNLKKWRLDFTTDVGARGFGDDLFGRRNELNGSAFGDLQTGALDDWRFGFELQGPVGNRRGHLAVRNAELRLVREKTLLREQQRQLLLDLNAAYTEIDRSFATIKSNYNAVKAVEAELEPLRKRAEAGDEDIFFLLSAQQRASTFATSYHRSVVDYNLALQDFVFTSGSLLEHYNIRLVEGEWIQQAYEAAGDKTNRFRYSQPNPSLQDTAPLSRGPVAIEPDLTILNQPLDNSFAPAVAPTTEGDSEEEQADPAAESQDDQLGILPG